jgi:hypothetical protein
MLARIFYQLFFCSHPVAEHMDDFVEQEPDGRKEILLKLLDNTAKRIGAIDTWGLLHSTPISHGRKLDGADEQSFRAELAKQTSTTLTTSYDGVVNIAIRHADGRIDYPTNR